MENIIIKDGMRKESRRGKAPMIFCYVLAALSPLSLIRPDVTISDFIEILLFFILIGTYLLFLYLYAYKYEVIATTEKIYLKTLFRKIELNICDIEKYSCNRYRKTVFYQFNLFIKGKKILINTRYKDEFEKILKDWKIEEIIRKKRK